MNCYITGIEIENFRNFETKTPFELRPITVLTGTNNSGKSSVSKALLLMKENNKRENIATLNLGFLKGLSAKNIFNVGSGSQELKVTISTGDVGKGSEYMPPLLTDDQGKYILFEVKHEFLHPFTSKDVKTYKIIYRPKNIASIPSLFEMRWVLFQVIEQKSNRKHTFWNIEKENRIECHWGNLRTQLLKKEIDSILDRLDISLSKNQRDKLDNAIRNSLIKISNLFYHGSFSQYFKIKEDNLTDLPELYRKAFINHLPNTYLFNTNEETGEEEIVTKPESSFSIVLQDILSQELSFDINSLKGKSSMFDYIPKLVNKEELFSTLPSFDGLRVALDKLFLINTVRVQQSPFYLQDYNRETFSGLITYLAHNYSLLQQLAPFIDFWIKEFEIGDKLIIEPSENGSELRIQKGEFIFNANDIGFGSLQLISLILNIAINPEKVIILEEPEINLHPKIQSKLADFIIDSSIKFRIQFIVETHSEYLIRKLQYWVANKTLENKNVIIHYLFDPMNKPEGEEQVQAIQIQEDGSLEGGFGPGFFDEATNIQFELLKLNQQQFN